MVYCVCAAREVNCAVWASQVKSGAFSSVKDGEIVKPARHMEGGRRAAATVYEAGPAAGRGRPEPVDVKADQPVIAARSSARCSPNFEIWGIFFCLEEIWRNLLVSELRLLFFCPLPDGLLS